MPFNLPLSIYFLYLMPASRYRTTYTFHTLISMSIVIENAGSDLVFT